MSLRPFIRYYGGKWRAAPLYPAPQHTTIVEPFAGAAGYSMRHYRRNVILVEKYAPLAEMWRWLIAVTPAEVLRIPCVESVDDLPSWVSDGARKLVGFSLGACGTTTCRNLSAGLRKNIASGNDRNAGWSSHKRDIVASQVVKIKHWRIIEGDWTAAPPVLATWFIDPPYNNFAGSHYVHGSHKIDYMALGDWCRSRIGQVMVCENEGADWLPFRPLAQLRRGLNKPVGSREAIWTNVPMGQQALWSTVSGG